ncbi:MFS transporter [Krasilnikovia sp. M28-CT-15]|uniref:MFS transporter n=1 Tax=Krasilnikovia sp. M28-CT-15 TaxID=3373540 RepID=UPI003876ACCA
MRLPSDFRLLVTGMALSWLGNGFQTVALAVAVAPTGGARDLGLVMACSVVAMLACTLFGGVWADRLQPQRVMIGADLVRFATTGAIAVMFGSGGYHLPALCALAAVSSGAGAFFSPALMALKPLLVTPARRQSTNATLSLVQTCCAVLGPALGGLTVARFGASTGFAVNAASFLASTAAAALIRAHAPRAPRGRMWQDLGAGWREIRTRDWLLAGVLSATVYHIANGVVFVLVQVLAVERLGGASAAGFVASAEGLGGVVGAAVALRLRPARLLRAGWFALFLMPLWALAYVWPGVLLPVMAGAVAGYAGLSFFSVAWETALQDHVPHAALGRVHSWDMLTSFVAMPVGSALAGPLSEAYGMDRVLVVCSVVFALAAAAPLLVPASRRLTRAPAAAEPPVMATAGV